ncbi:diguanylate cyclase [Streptomyces decoyicus]|uniref:diguanylate cyclase n=1 Tax=Streptomyces decoyicus TaxID=249567 RepID=UPI0004AA90E8|nr:diguanylate cyclase [Streptomyces decoyicus]KOG49177.1 diguanylate cyclase [Streptomyces decoyicus]QZY19437.1 diguanylate cyclase [Streptomyces decoyicus]
MDLHRSPVARAWRKWRRPSDLPVPRRPRNAEDTSRRFLMYGVMPLWFVPSVADWVMHRRTRIEETTGVRESAVHALMMAEAGVPVAMGLLAKVNPLVLSVMGGAALLHGATALWDVNLATTEREVRPTEQHIHSFLEVLPLTALAFLGCLHADQVRGTLRGGRSADDWKLLPKESPLPARYLAVIGLGIGVCVALPYAEEMTRCVKAARRRGTR